MIKTFLKKLELKPKDTLVDNPLYKNGPFIALSDSKDYEYSYLELLEQVIQKKLNKNHNKNNLILVLDDRTIKFSKKEHDDALIKLSTQSSELQFSMIWVYIGYYSDDDGLNAEFYLRRIK